MVQPLISHLADKPQSDWGLLILMSFFLVMYLILIKYGNKIIIK